MLYLLKKKPAHALPIRLIGLAAFTLYLLGTNATAQSSKSSVTVSISGPTEVKIQIALASPAESWSFRNAYAGALGLGERIEQFQARRSNESVPVRRIATGEYRSETLAENVSYVVRIPPGQPGDLAHISWLTGDCGLLMLADLLPESADQRQGVLVDFELPTGWLVHSSMLPDVRSRYFVDEPDKTVFLVGRESRLTSKQIRGMQLDVVVNSSWRFADKSVLKSAAKILEWYFELTGFKLHGKPTILLAPLPVSDSSVQWKAETRGSTVILLLNPRTEIKNWIGQLGVIFTHEIFHLWLPNSLTLTGDYDWFFEGFTLYAALQAALRLKLIGFQEYLNTLARVYDSYLSYPDNQTLIEASEKRWTSSATVVYDKGMLVALIYDLVVRRETNGKSSLADRYRSLFAHYADEPANANDVIIRLLTSSAATEGFSQSYIQSRNRIELEKILPSFGLQIDNSGISSHLSVRKELTRDQRDLLRSLGYKK